MGDLDKEADFARQVSMHRRALLRYAMRRLEDVESAEDLVAETFVVSWRRWHESPGRDQELPWLYGIASRLILNVQRAERRRWRLHARLASEREQEAVLPRFSADDVLRLIDALDELSPIDREAVLLTYWDRLSQRDVGAVLSCSENAVAHRLSRARRALLERMAATSHSSDPTRGEARGAAHE